MDFIPFFANIFAYTFSIFAGLLIFAKLIWPKIESLVLKLSSINRNKAFIRENLQLTYTAYERLILFTSRIEPYQLMLRLHQPTLSVSAFKAALIQEIEKEFQHNFTQQLYVSTLAWHTVKELKQSTIGLLQNSANTLPDSASIDQYVQLVLSHVSQLESNPYEDAQLVLKNELSV